MTEHNYRYSHRWVKMSIVIVFWLSLSLCSSTSASYIVSHNWEKRELKWTVSSYDRFYSHLEVWWWDLPLASVCSSMSLVSSGTSGGPWSRHLSWWWASMNTGSSFLQMTKWRCVWREQVASSSLHLWFFHLLCSWTSWLVLLSMTSR